jgi:hypothetical protein
MATPLELLGSRRGVVKAAAMASKICAIVDTVCAVSVHPLLELDVSA